MKIPNVVWMLGVASMACRPAKPVAGTTEPPAVRSLAVVLAREIGDVPTQLGVAVAGRATAVDEAAALEGLRARNVWTTALVVTKREPHDVEISLTDARHRAEEDLSRRVL